MKGLVILLVSIVGSGKHQPPNPIWVDVIESNHVVRGDKVCLHQIIYWRWKWDGRLHAEAWRSVKEDYMPQRVRGVWVDEANGTRVYARSFRERWTDYDPEMLDRQEWPVERRTWK